MHDVRDGLLDEKTCCAYYIQIMIRISKVSAYNFRRNPLPYIQLNPNPPLQLSPLCPSACIPRLLLLPSLSPSLDRVQSFDSPHNPDPANVRIRGETSMPHLQPPVDSPQPHSSRSTIQQHRTRCFHQLKRARQTRHVLTSPQPSTIFSEFRVCLKG